MAAGAPDRRVPAVHPRRPLKPMSDPFDLEADRIRALLPPAPHLVVIGSTDFWHPQSEATCALLGRLLAVIPGLVLITGGVEGIGEATGRSFFQARHEAS